MPIVHVTPTTALERCNNLHAQLVLFVLFVTLVLVLCVQHLVLRWQPCGLGSHSAFYSDASQVFQPILATYLRLSCHKSARQHALALETVDCTSRVCADRNRCRYTQKVTVACSKTGEQMNMLW